MCAVLLAVKSDRYMAVHVILLSRRRCRPIPFSFCTWSCISTIKGEITNTNSTRSVSPLDVWCKLAVSGTSEFRLECSQTCLLPPSMLLMAVSCSSLIDLYPRVSMSSSIDCERRVGSALTALLHSWYNAVLLAV